MRLPLILTLGGDKDGVNHPHDQVCANMPHPVYMCAHAYISAHIDAIVTCLLVFPFCSELRERGVVPDYLGASRCGCFGTGVYVMCWAWATEQCSVTATASIRAGGKWVPNRVNRNAVA